MKNKKYIIIFIYLTIFGFFCYIRKPRENNLYSLSDATYHVILTMNAYSENDYHNHKFLPIQSFKGASNKYIVNGESLLMTSDGNSYYVSFPASGFFIPYLFARIFNLKNDVNTLYIFNSLVMLISSVGVYFLINKLFNNKTIAILSSILYIFSPEIMLSQGIVYWHHSLSMCIMLFQLYFFLEIYNEMKIKKIFLTLFFITSLIFPLLEWTGYISNLGFCLYFFLKGTKISKKKIEIDNKNLYLTVVTGLITILSLLILLLHFGTKFEMSEYINELLSRASSRSKSNILLLIDGYIKSFKNIWMLLIIAIIAYACRKETKKINKEELSLLILMLFPMIENLIMMEHAKKYSFDRMKLFIPLIYLIILIYRKTEIKINKYIYLLVILTCCYGVYLYQDYIYKDDNIKNNVVLKEYIENEYLNNKNGMLVAEGYRAWGYLQLLYNQNIYSTKYYSEEEIENIAEGKNIENIIYIERDDGKGDKTVHESAIVINNNKQYRLEVNDNKVIKKEDNNVYIANITDDNWDHGVYKLDGNLLLLNNRKWNREFLLKRKNINCNNKVYDINEIEYKDNYIYLKIKGNKNKKCSGKSIIS